MSSGPKSEAPPCEFMAQTRKPYSFPRSSELTSHDVAEPEYTLAKLSAAEP